MAEIVLNYNKKTEKPLLSFPDKKIQFNLKIIFLYIF